MTRVSIVGTGYVGLVTGACLADRGHQVECVDVDASKVDRINRSEPPIYEVGLEDLLKKHIGKRLRATTNLLDAVRSSDVTFIAVGTPSTEGQIDLQFIRAAAEEIGAALREKATYHIVVVKSTVVPATTDTVVKDALEKFSGKLCGDGFGLGMNPEFLTEGTAIRDFMDPDRLVFGSSDPRTTAALTELYESFSADVPRIHTNCRTAEFIKYASNALLATMISFANELSRVSIAIGGVDIEDVLHGVHESLYLTTRIGTDRRVAANITSFLAAGCGFGGSCLPKDVQALAAQGEGLGLSMRLLRAVLEVNRTQPLEILALIQSRYPSVDGLRIAILGVAFKPDTDDVRESPAFPIMRLLMNAGARLAAFDPLVKKLPSQEFDRVRVADSLTDALAHADVAVLVTRWNEFQELPHLLRSQGRSLLVVDGRRALDARDFEHYVGIGKGT